jgi:hypothetical protein
MILKFTYICTNIDLGEEQLVWEVDMRELLIQDIQTALSVNKQNVSLSILDIGTSMYKCMHRFYSRCTVISDCQ